jgi:hypothetical protein
MKFCAAFVSLRPKAKKLISDFLSLGAEGAEGAPS